MNQTIKSALAAFALTGLLTVVSSADEVKKDDKSEMGMMQKMDMKHMHSMMDECMNTQKDKKMCKHDMMEKCEKQMSKDECTKMMKKVKK